MIDHLVRRFYAELWEQGNEARASGILHPDLTFRGSVGLSKTGIDGYLDYLRLIRTALGDYRCDILSLVCKDHKAAAKMRFHGLHRADFLGIPATHRRIEWLGAAFFEMRDNRLADIWVLGDTDALRAQLKAT